jgi:hypothetical protein
MKKNGMSHLCSKNMMGRHQLKTSGKDMQKMAMQCIPCRRTSITNGLKKTRLAERFR